MKNMIKKIDKMTNMCQVMVLILPNGMTLAALVKETKKHFELYNTLIVMKGVDQEGKEFVSFTPLQPNMMVESCNTMIDKQGVMLLTPSEQFKSFYLSRITGGAKKSSSTQKKDKKEEDEVKSDSDSNNMIVFSKFNEYRNKKANLSLVAVSANTPSPDVA